MELEKRVYVGGLSSSIESSDLESRFSRFGSVSNLEIINKSTPVGTIQRFAYLNFRTDEDKWQKCKSYLSNATFKGSKLRIEEARPYYLVKLQQEKKIADFQSTNNNEKNEDHSTKVDLEDPVFHGEIIVPGKHSKNMQVVTDSDVRKDPPRKGWKKGPYGRAIVVLRMYNKNTKKTRLFYPLGKNCLQKLWGRVETNMDNTTAFYDSDHDEYISYGGKRASRDKIRMQAKLGIKASTQKDDNDFELLNNTTGEIEVTKELNEEQLDALRKKDKDTAASVLAELFGSENTEEIDTVSKTSGVLELDNDSTNNFQKEGLDEQDNLQKEESVHIDVPAEFEASDERTAVVNVDNLKEMFSSNAQDTSKFSLFGNENGVGEESEMESEIDDRNYETMEEEADGETPLAIVKASSGTKGWPKMFTLPNPSSLFQPGNEDYTSREALESWWSENRLFLTRDYKRKRKDAVKRQRRAHEKRIRLV